MLIQFPDDHLFVFPIDVNVDLLVYRYYFQVFLLQYVDVYDYFHYYFHLYFVYEIHLFQKNVYDLRLQNANVVVYVTLNDFARYISI